MLLRCAIGIVVGIALGIAAVVFLFLPWEARVDPQGFNYIAGPEMLFIVFAGAVFGCIVGCVSYSRRRKTAERLQMKTIKPPPEDKIWPPPPSSPPN